MLNNPYFYHRLTRKYVILFGNLFNDITVMRKNNDTDTELYHMKVPLVYATKEKYFTRLREDPDLNRPVQIVLPRMSFQLMNMTYDSTRKQNSLLKVAKGSDAGKVKSQYMGVPYDLNFDLFIYSRNVDDGTHIVEQILPFFNPDYTVTIESIPNMGFLRDIPVILNSVSNNVEYEGNFDSVRFVMWTLSFTLKAHYYGPITEPKIIRTSIANIYRDPSIRAGYVVRMNTGDCQGTFKMNDVVYQGDNYQTATAYGILLEHNDATNKIVIGAAQGSFKVGETVHGLSTNASCNLVSFEVSPLLYTNITVEPDPLDAEPGDDYGYTTTITEWPETENT